jgi:hypothetical protein
MTICSWRTQSPERPLNFVRLHAKLREEQGKTHDHEWSRNRHSALCQSLKFERSIPEMTFAAPLQSIRLMHRYLGLFLAPTIPFFRDYGWSADVRAARDSSWQFLYTSQHPRASFTIA